LVHKQALEESAPKPLSSCNFLIRPILTGYPNFIAI
jgi:hypothetical protein